MRRIAMIMVGVLAGLGVACGSGSGNEIEIAEVGADTVDAGSARMSFQMSISGVDLDGEGVFEFAERRGTMDFDFGPLMEQSGMPVDGDATMNAVFDGDIFYLRMPFVPQMGDKWIRVSLKELGEEGGVDLSQLPNVNSDPSSFLAMLNGVEKFEEVGEGEVRGDSTTQFEVTINLRDAYEDAGAITNKEAFDALIEQMGTEKVDADVWVDDDNRLRRMTMQVPMPALGPRQKAEMTFEIYDFGAEVEVELPDESTVIDMSELMEGAPTG